jgi:hypothetical protein
MTYEINASTSMLVSIGDDVNARDGQASNNFSWCMETRAS